MGKDVDRMRIVPSPRVFSLPVRNGESRGMGNEDRTGSRRSGDYIKKGGRKARKIP
jgi:hypothetical protein